MFGIRLSKDILPPVHRMKKLFALFRLNLADLLEYRLDLFIYTIGSIARPAAMMAIWVAAYSSGAKIPMEQNTLLQYYLFLLFVSLLTDAWGAPFIMSAIRLGKLSPFLLRPSPYIFQQLSNNLMEKAIKVIYLVPAIFVLGLIFRTGMPSIDFLKVVLFVLTVFFAFALNFLISFLIGITAFWLDEAAFLDDFVDLIIYVFSGLLFPIALFPRFMQTISSILPFRYALSLPIEIVLGQITGTKLLWAISSQIGWLLVAIFAVKYFWGRGVKKYSASGA